MTDRVEIRESKNGYYPYNWGCLTPAQFRELYEDHGGADARFQYYGELLRITGWPDTPETFWAWSQMAYVALSKAKGRLS